MSPDTAATKRPEIPAAHAPETQSPAADAQVRRPQADDAESGPPGPRRPNRLWTYLTVSAGAAFAGALILAATGLVTDTAEVSDTPERSVESFLGSLLDDRDASAAGTWLCEEKADRDLTEATAALAAAGEQRDVDWSNVSETGRSVGGATVTADLSTGGEAVTWTFTLVAEEGDPQWQVCGIARR